MPATMDYTFDTGTNITSLGYFWLILKYLLPVVIGLILISIAAIGAFIGFKNINTSHDIKTITFVVAVGFLVLIVLLT